MAITTYDKFFPYVQPYVPECPEFVIEKHVAEAATQFCEETYIWQVDVEEDTTSAGEFLYELDVPTSTLIEDVNFINLDGVTLHRIDDEAGATAFHGKEGKPRYYSLSADFFVRFYPTPDAAYVFSGQAVVKPSLLSTGIETFIFNTFGRDIACGAIALLQAIPGKAWTDHALAANNMALFNRGVGRAKVRKYRSTPTRVHPRPFA